jgi:pimeloyl-ACP methyl ester carboxylesterase
MSDLVPLEHMAPVPHRLEVQKLMVEMGTSLGPDLFIRQSRALQRRRDYQSSLSRIKIPATVMTGADDPMISPKRLKFMTDMIPRGHLHLIENAGHLPHLEQPAATLAALQTWLKQPLVLG